MFDLVKRDYLFAKKVILVSIVCCIVGPLILSFKSDRLSIYLDVLFPMAVAIAPLFRIMDIEDLKSGVYYQDSRPYTAYEKVGARFIFTFSLLVLSNIF